MKPVFLAFVAVLANAQAQDSVLARLHQADALARPLFSETRPPDRPQRIEQAARIYEGILKENPNHALALWNLAVVTGASGRVEDSLSLTRKLIQANPRYRDAYYLAGVLDWVLVGKAIGEARAGSQSSARPGDITDDGRKKLSASQLPVVDDGLAMMTKALEIDPNFTEAVVWQNLLLRRKASLMENALQRGEFLAQAGEVLKKVKTMPKVGPREVNIDPRVEPPPLPYPGPPRNPPGPAGDTKKEQ